MNKVFGLASEFSLVKEEGTRTTIGYGMTAVDEEHAEWGEVYIPKKVAQRPTLEQVKAAIIGGINQATEEEIIGGFVWNGIHIWLSAENQRNFSEAQRMGITPITFKLGEGENGAPIYHTFETMADADDFYIKAVAYINQILADGWTEKDGIDWEPYEAYFQQNEQVE
jgi:hypothetical protein